MPWWMWVCCLTPLLLGLARGVRFTPGNESCLNCCFDPECESSVTCGGCTGPNKNVLVTISGLYAHGSCPASDCAALVGTWVLPFNSAKSGIRCYWTLTGLTACGDALTLELDGGSGTWHLRLSGFSGAEPEIDWNGSSATLTPCTAGTVTMSCDTTSGLSGCDCEDVLGGGPPKDATAELTVDCI